MDTIELSHLTYISGHCLRAYRKHHQDALVCNVLENLRRGEIIEPEMALTLVGRRKRKTESMYILPPDRRGLFVIEPGNEETCEFPRPYTMVTYLRFGLPQEEFVIKHWGAETRQIKKTDEDTSKSSDEDQEWFEASGLTLYRLEAEPELLQIFGGKRGLKKAIRRSIPVQSGIGKDKWRVERKLKDPVTGTSYFLKYSLGSCSPAQAFFSVEKSFLGGSESG